MRRKSLLYFNNVKDKALEAIRLVFTVITGKSVKV